MPASHLNVCFLIGLYQEIKQIMMKINAPVIVTSIVTSILVVNRVMIDQHDRLDLAMLIFCISPFLMIWLVLTILRDKSFKYPELPAGQHWGYRGKNKDDLGVF